MSCLQALCSAGRPPGDVTSAMTLPADQQLPPLPRILTRASPSGPRSASSKLTTQLPPGLARPIQADRRNRVKPLVGRPRDDGPPERGRARRAGRRRRQVTCRPPTGVSRLTSGRKQQTSATLLQPGHGGEPPPRPAHPPGGPRAEGIPHDREALPIAARPPRAGRPVAGALAGTARRLGRPGYRATSRSARGIQQRGHSGVLADPAGHGFTSRAARRVIAPAGQAAAHARRPESRGGRLGKPGSPVRKPVDDLCKGAASLCATRDSRWGFLAGRALEKALTCDNTIRTLCIN